MLRITLALALVLSSLGIGCGSSPRRSWKYPQTDRGAPRIPRGRIAKLKPGDLGDTKCHELVDCYRHAKKRCAGGKYEVIDSAKEDRGEGVLDGVAIKAGPNVSILRGSKEEGEAQYVLVFRCTE